MKNFDPIDILFIVLISCYLITFIAIIVSVILKYKDYNKNKVQDDNKDNLEIFEEILATPIAKNRKKVVEKTDVSEILEKTESKAKNVITPKKKSTSSNKSNAPEEKTTIPQKKTTKSTATKKSTTSAKKGTSTKRKTTTKKSASKKGNSTSTKKSNTSNSSQKSLS